MSARPSKAKAGAYHHGDLRRAIVDAAVRLVAEEGAAAVSLRDLAVRVGVSHQAPYRHFATKEALFAEIAAEGFRILRDAEVRARDAAPDDVIERLRAIGLAYVEVAIAHPGHMKVMFGRLAGDVVGPEGADAFGVLVDAIVAGQQAGRVRAGDPIGHAIFAWASVHGLATLVVEGALERLGPVVSAADRARDAIALLLDALAPPPPPPASLAHKL